MKKSPKSLREDRDETPKRALRAMLREDWAMCVVAEYAPAMPNGYWRIAKSLTAN